MEVSKFEYDPLPSPDKWIRTLIIDPRSTKERIICTLVPGSLKNQHICLSYTWGTQSASHGITVNGKILFIRENLLNFLVECQRDQYLLDQPLWIDAVCINQDDLPEKNCQVAQMGEIYAQAKRVIVWLGCGDETVTGALRHVQAYADSPLIDPDVIEAQETTINNELTKNMNQTDYSGIPLRAHWNNFDTVTNLPYWKRMWIVQELLSAKDSDIWYGNLRTKWWTLIEYLSLIENYAGPDGCDPQLGYKKTRRSSCAWLLRRLALKEEVPSMSSMLPFSIALSQLRQECFDRRDLIYGGRALDNDLKSIPVDYESHACKLLPALFGSPAVKSDFVYIGLLIIDRLGLDIHETIGMTYDYLSGQTWSTDLLNIGLVLEGKQKDQDTVWKINWNAFAHPRKLDKSVLFNDGVGSVTHSNAHVSVTLDLQAGDLICHIAMVNLLLIFRNNRRAEEPTEINTTSTSSIPPPNHEQATAAVADYKFSTCFEITSNISNGQRPRLNKEYLNIRIQHNEKTANFISEIKESHLKVDVLGGYRLMLSWRALLRVWELRDTGIVTYKPAYVETVGSWDEEEAKVKERASKALSGGTVPNVHARPQVKLKGQ